MREQPHLPKTRTAPTSSMPIDKQTNGKPITPALSSNFRANTKSPLTPRLVGSAPNSPASSARRDAVNRARSPVREATPASPLNGNVTPRTAMRRSRIGTDSPATPGSNKPATSTRPRAVSGAGVKSIQSPTSGLGIMSPSHLISPAPAIAQTPAVPPLPAYTVHRRVSGTKSAIQAQDNEDSKFFRADDVRSYVSERPGPTTDATSFFFVGSPGTQSSLSSTVSPVRDTQPKVEDKFFHANEAPKPLVNAPVRPGLSKSMTAPVHAVRSQQLAAATPKTTKSPSSSPKKLSKPEGQPYPLQKDSTRKVLTPANPTLRNIDRRGSIGSSLSNGKPDIHLRHKKSMSASSIATVPERKASSPRVAALAGMDQRLAEPVNASTLLLDRSVGSAAPTDSFQPSPISTKVTTASPELIATRSPGLTSSTSDPKLTSPTSETFPEPLQPPSRPLHDPANARRERKVLDLEISNSSLLAINKTLERELRKQNTELRRFRRLSRSGRLSIAPTNRSISASTLDTVAEADADDSDVSAPEDDSDLDTIDDDPSDILSNDSSSVHSPTSRAKQRARDERRLMLDLSKHQQMLLDSQKLTQSIRRCLTCTEELIKDGNKALEYRVGIGDLKLGGRVLSRDEEKHEESSSDGEEQQRRPLLSPSLTLSQLEEATLWLTKGFGEGGQVDGALEEIDRGLHDYQQ